MENIFEPNTKFDFSKLSLGQPQVIQSSNYFTKLLFENKEFFLQFPKCKTKQGIIQNEKKMHADLIYDSFNNPELSEWAENLEETCQKLIYNKRNAWFTDNIELNDIESAFNNLVKYQKNGKQMIIRCYITRPQAIKLSPLCIVYDENENKLSINDVTFDKDIIPLVKLEGIRFSSRNFQIELNLVQIMVLKEEDNQCLIKIKNGDNNTNNSNNLSSGGTNIIKNNEQDLEKSNKDELIIINDRENEDETYFEKDEFNLEEENKDKDLNTNTLSNLNENDIEVDDFISLSNKSKLETQTHINDLIERNEINMTNRINNTNTANITNTTNTINTANMTNKISEDFERNQREDKNKEDNSDCLEIVDFDLNEITETIKLKKPNEIYYEIYRAAREKAKLAKKLAIEAYLEAKKIKTKYMLDDLDESDDEISTMENL